MVIVAGPSGGGKSSILSIRNFEGVAPFSTDEYCAELNGKRLNQSGPVYVGIPPAIRREAGAALERFIAASISARRSFSFETTLREVTFEQAAHAAMPNFALRCSL